MPILHFHHLIEGQQMLLLADHKPLCGTFYSLNQVKSYKQQKQLALITEYIFGVEHKKENAM